MSRTNDSDLLGIVMEVGSVWLFPSPTWTLSGSWAWNHNHFNETGFDNFNQIQDATQTGGLPGQRGTFTPIGLGCIESTTENTYRLDVATSNTQTVKCLLVTHTVTVG